MEIGNNGRERLPAKIVLMAKESERGPFYMNQYENKLADYIKKHDIQTEHLVFQKSCHSVEEAASAAGVTAEDFIKSICLTVKGEELIVAIVKGEDKASLSRVRKELDINRPRILSPEEILQKTGYPCGGVPPFGYEGEFLIDDKVMAVDTIYGGGGSEKSLVKLTPSELQKVNGGKVARIRK